MVAVRIESCLGLSTAVAVDARAQWADKHGGSASTSGVCSAGLGRNGGNALTAGGGTSWTGVCDAAATVWAGGAHFSTTVTAGELFSFLDGTVTHITINVNSDGSLSAVRSTGGGTILATSAAGVFVAASYDYWECRVLVSDTVGTVDVLKNGVNVLTFTGDTRNAGTLTITQVKYWHESGTVRWCDLYYGATGAFWGDGRVELLKPNAAGATQQWTRGGADSGSDFGQVDEQTPNEDTDYLTSGTVGQKFTFGYEDLVSTAGVVQGVQLVARSRKDDAGTRSIVQVARVAAGTEVDGPVATLGTTYVSATDLRTTKPGGGAWAIADVNGAQFGVKVNA